MKNYRMDEKEYAQNSAISGGLGVLRSRPGQVTISNEFDAMHFLRIKDVNDKVKSQLPVLLRRSALLENILDAVTVKNPGQYGELGRAYLKSSNASMKLREEEEQEEENRRRKSAVEGNNEVADNSQRHNVKMSSRQDEQLEVSDNAEVFEMVKRVSRGRATMGSGDNIDRLLYDEIDREERGGFTSNIRRDESDMYEQTNRTNEASSRHDNRNSASPPYNNEGGAVG